MYKAETFKSYTEVTAFLNKNQIPKQDIIGITQRVQLCSTLGSIKLEYVLFYWIDTNNWKHKL